MAASCLQCGHDFEAHAKVYDEYIFERFCLVCDCMGWEGDIDEAFEDMDLERLWGEGII